MRMAVMVNDFETLVASQATALLIEIAARREHDVFVFGVGDWILNHGDSIALWGRRAATEGGRGEMVRGLRQAAPSRVAIETLDLLLIRTNPARDRARAGLHDAALFFARLAQERGLLVLNDPQGLQRGANKLYLAYLPEEYRPSTHVSARLPSLRSGADELEGGCVLKPLQGTRGRDVFFFGAEARMNFAQTAEVLLREGYVMQQAFLPDAYAGDVRLIVMEGELLEEGGHVAAVHRVPPPGDFRSNIHTGGRAAPAKVTDAMRAVVTAIGPRLRRDGIFLAGLDFIGGKLIEINVYSTGGLEDAERFTGVPFAERVVERLEARVG